MANELLLYGVPLAVLYIFVAKAFVRKWKENNRIKREKEQAKNLEGMEKLK